MAVGDIFAGLDIGSNHLRLIIATEESNNIVINTVRNIKTFAVINGEINNIQQFNQDLKTLLGKNYISSLNISFSSPSVTGNNFTDGFTKISGKVKKTDIEEAIHDAKEWKNSENKYRVSIPNSFELDHKIKTHKPLNRKAKTMKVDYHLLTMQKEVVDNIKTAIRSIGVDIKAQCVGLSSLYDFLLSSDQKYRGCCLLDIGHNLANFTVFYKSKILFNNTISILNNSVENAIMNNYNCSYDEASRLKENYGFIGDIVEEDEFLIGFVNNANEEKYLSNHDLSLIITKQYKNILTEIKRILMANEIKTNVLKSGFIVIGGGAKIKNLRQLIVKIFNAPANIKKIDNNLLSRNKIAHDNILIDNSQYIKTLATLMYKENNDYLLNNNDPATTSKFVGSIMRMFN